MALPHEHERSEEHGSPSAAESKQPGRQPNPGNELQRFVLDHPTVGEICFYYGTDQAIRAIDRGWPVTDDDPAKPAAGTGENTQHTSDRAQSADRAAGTAPAAEQPCHALGESAAFLTAEGQTIIDRARADELCAAATAYRQQEETKSDNAHRSLKTRISSLDWRQVLSAGYSSIVTINNRVVYRDLGSPTNRIVVHPSLPAGKLPLVAERKPSDPKYRMQIHTTVRGQITMVLVQVDPAEGWLTLQAPPASISAKRLKAMEESPVKAFVIPVSQGIGKVGWLLLAAVLGPLVGKFLAWIGSFLPDIEIPWPDIHWPQWNVHLPDWLHWDIPFPEFSLPDWWPAITPPDWLVWLLDHEDYFKPLIIGLIVGGLMFRNVYKSRKTKDRWQQATTESRSQASSPGDPEDNSRRNNPHPGSTEQ
ncbi:hypothetical protein ACFPVT_02110 [Corynebacterium choanae]|uniref:Uncharacterized protein n=1 Tax=Corynebacterium choanae TaxID=1862358 RepID=A0A3G6J936_9CORY|nr:hypothetical protein [Corynebacterium choanae]AZA12970.1 hypothetical protein CCHOA_02770 [Corynebacterium choanae]